MKLRRCLTRGEVTYKQPVLHHWDTLRGNSLVVITKSAQAGGDGGVDSQIYFIGAIAKGAKLVGGKEAGTSIGGLAAQYAVQFNRVATTLVDLQRKLAATQDNSRDTAGALRRGQKGDCFFGRLPGVAGQIQRNDEFPAGCPLVAAKGIRIAPLLHVVFVDGNHLQASAALDDLLLDESPFSAGKGFHLADGD